MTRQAVNRIGAIAPFVCSALALALVLANIAGGVRPARTKMPARTSFSC